jgi:hypothetical protein
MRGSRGWRLIIFLAVFFALGLAAILAGDLWKRHDSSDLLLHTSVLLNFILLFGLIVWFGQMWKYFRLAGWLVYVICAGSLAIHRLNNGSMGGPAVWALALIWGVYQLKEEIVKHMTNQDTQETCNQLLTGSKK